jgi:hypothetical protein
MAEHGMTRGVGNQKGITGNGNGRTRNGSLPLTVLINSRDIQFALPGQAGPKATNLASFMCESKTFLL